MSEITVRPLAQDDWQTYRDIRLQALQADPDAFAASYEDEQGYDEAFWRERMTRSVRLLAELGDEPTGVVSIGRATTEDHDGSGEVSGSGDDGGTDGTDAAGEVFGLWVAPQHRSKGSATRLLRTAVDQARRMGHEHLVYWVGTDNGRAVAFASSHGFRPTDYRRPMRLSNGSDEEEIAMVLPLVEDPGPHPRLS